MSESTRMSLFDFVNKYAIIISEVPAERSPTIKKQDFNRVIEEAVLSTGNKELLTIPAHFKLYVCCSCSAFNMAVAKLYVVVPNVDGEDTIMELHSIDGNLLSHDTRLELGEFLDSNYSKAMMIESITSDNLWGPKGSYRLVPEYLFKSCSMEYVKVDESRTYGDVFLNFELGDSVRDDVKFIDNLCLREKAALIVKYCITAVNSKRHNKLPDVNSRDSSVMLDVMFDSTHTMRVYLDEDYRSCESTFISEVKLYMDFSKETTYDKPISESLLYASYAYELISKELADTNFRIMHHHNNICICHGFSYPPQWKHFINFYGAHYQEAVGNSNDAEIYAELEKKEKAIYETLCEYDAYVIDNLVDKKNK